MRFLYSILAVSLSLLPTTQAALSQCITSIQVSTIFRDHFTYGPNWNPDFETPDLGYGAYVLQPAPYNFAWGNATMCIGDMPVNCPIGCRVGNTIPTACQNVMGHHRKQVQPVLSLDDYTPIYRNAALDGMAHTIRSAQTFYSWYHDVPYGSPEHKAGSPPNCKKTGTITLNRVGTSGLFQYTNTNFFPLNGQCWDDVNYLRTTTGDPNAQVQYAMKIRDPASTNTNNFGFTSEVHGSFRYNGKETFVFCGDDDVWVFIDTKLVIDIGGVHGEICRAFSFAEMDKDGYITPYDCRAFPCPASALQPNERLKVGPLTVGTVYYMDMYHAERHTTASNFALTTSIELGYTDTQGEASFLLSPDPDNGIDLQLNPLKFNMKTTSGMATEVVGNSTTVYAIAQIIPDSALKLSCVAESGLVQPFYFQWTKCGTIKTQTATVKLTTNNTAINAAIKRGQGIENILCKNDAVDGLYVNLTASMRVSFYRFPPKAIIVPSATTLQLPIAEADALQLDGSQSTDPDSDSYLISFAWSQVSGPSSQFGDASSSTTSVMLSTPGTYVFRLTLIDEVGNTDTTTVSIVLKAEPTTLPPTTLPPTTLPPTTLPPTTKAPTTAAPTTQAPSTAAPTTKAPTTVAPVTSAPGTGTTAASTTAAPSTAAPSTAAPTTQAPTTAAPTTKAPTTAAPTTQAPSTAAPTTQAPSTAAPTTKAPTTKAPTTATPTTATPTTEAPTSKPRPTYTPGTDLPPLDSGNATLAPGTNGPTSTSTSAPTNTPTGTPTGTTTSTPIASSSSAGSSTPAPVVSSTGASSVPVNPTTSPSSTGSGDMSSTVPTLDSSSSSSSSSGLGDLNTEGAGGNNGDSIGNANAKDKASSSSSSFPLIPVIAGVAGGVVLLALIIVALIMKKRAAIKTRDRVFTDSVVMPRNINDPDMVNFTESPLHASTTPQAFTNEPPTLRWSRAQSGADAV